MPDLSGKQRQFQNAILSGDASDAATLVLPAGPAALERLAIYRNHFLESLVETLATTYPVTQRLVGAGYFSALAKRHVGADPPRDPRLSLYGSGLAATIARSPECQAVPYLSDVARLEWALREAAEALEDLPLEVGEVCRSLAERGCRRGTLICSAVATTPLRLACRPDLALPRERRSCGNPRDRATEPLAPGLARRARAIRCRNRARSVRALRTADRG